MSLNKILSCFTGADRVPPLGYACVVLSFNHKNPYPTSSTCAVERILPTRHQVISMLLLQCTEGLDCTEDNCFIFCHNIILANNYDLATMIIRTCSKTVMYIRRNYCLKFFEFFQQRVINFRDIYNIVIIFRNWAIPVYAKLDITLFLQSAKNYGYVQI